MKFANLLKLIFGGVTIAAEVLEMIGEQKGWTGGAKLAKELRDVAEKAGAAFRTDPVFKSEIDADELSHIWPAS